MRVKLRPDAHCAPVPQGVYWARGEHTFVLSGPPALHLVVDSQLDALLGGTSLDEMVAAAGDERARPVLEHVVRVLVAQDVLIDLDAVEGPLPDRETAARHAELLCYLETNCAEPYRAFAAVRAARVAVAGDGAAAQAARRGLAANGTGETTELRLPLAPDRSATATSVAVAAETATVVVLVDDHDSPLDLSATAALLASGTPVVPVVAGAALAVVGPVCTNPEELRAFQAVQARAAAWQEAGTQSAAPRPLSAVLAGALAAQVVLERLSGTDHGRHTAWVVHGHAVQTEVVPVPDAGPGPSWRAVGPTEVLVAALATADRADTAPGTDGGGPVGAHPTGDAGGDSESTGPAQFHLDAAVTARWTGLARWGRDLDLPQLPVNLVTAESAAGPHFLGWGTNRAAAGVTAGLSVLRHRAAQERTDESDAGWLPAAGLTPARWLADGLLRRAGQDELAPSGGTSLAWEDLGSIVVRSQWSVLRDFFGVPAALRLHTVSGLDWQLVSATDELTGEVLDTQWGPSRASAAYAALLAATARAQYRAAGPTAPQAPVLPPDPVGTWALEVVPEHRIHDCLRQLLARAKDMGLRPGARQLVRDEALGELPLTCGWVGLR
ncbi:hypothetical protein DN069_07820 [Streptacidiphilus pinicola]|uniref:YcaO domain-containing protein n=1 Tax=Streptacidiphilus pinicola TaxID=2219663 RepID=A0A2X0JF08_9ACTN|nr:hypothetical protein [Streptacidiphilus pinicola]RAG86178.1 hypothetical protein DN069_07820 [Streptacidiphilus pinicola]